MVNQINKDLDDYLNRRLGSVEQSKGKKKKKQVVVNEVPEIKDEYKTFVVDEEPKKPLFKRFLDWLFVDDSEEEVLETREEEFEEKISDEIEKAEEDLEDEELKEEQKVRNIFSRLFRKLRKIEAEELEEECVLDKDKIEELTLYKNQVNEDMREALDIIRRILIKLPSDSSINSYSIG